MSSPCVWKLSYARVCMKIPGYAKHCWLGTPLLSFTLRACLNYCTNLSASPFVDGWNSVEQTRFTPFSFANSPEINRGPLSLTNWWGNPNTDNRPVKYHACDTGNWLLSHAHTQTGFSVHAWSWDMASSFTSVRDTTPLSSSQSDSFSTAQKVECCSYCSIYGVHSSQS